MTDQTLVKMELPLEETLYQSILEQDQDTILLVLSKGANPNKTVGQGKTCLGEAAIIGNVDIFKLLITSSQTSSTLLKVSSYNINTRKRQVKCQKRKLKHQEQCEETIVKCKNLNDRTMKGSNFGQKDTIEISDYTTRADRNQGSFHSSDKPDHLKSLPITERNQGYFIFVHNESSSSDESKIGSLKSPLSPSSQTSSPQADLEWDEEIGNVAPATTEDEKCSSIYKWYAGILESTGAAIASASIVSNGINQQDITLRTALHYASEHNHPAVVTLLIEAGCRIDIPSGDGFTPMHVAVIKNHYEIVQILLKAGSQMNYTTHEGMTALHIASAMGFLDIVKLLVENGGYLEARDLDERTALYMAARKGREDVVRYLVAAGANVNAAEINGYTPLCEAVWQNYPVVLEILLNSGARVPHSPRLLHKAIGQGQEEIVKLLANFGGGINLHDDYGDTPLVLAAKLLRPKIAKILLNNGANANSWNNITGENALHMAVESDEEPIYFEELLKYLLEYKINLNTTALTGDTALSRALLLHHDHAAALLIRYGADVNNCDLQSCGLDNLSIASKRRTNNMASMLLKAGHYFPMPDPSAPVPKPGSTAYWLYFACKQPLSLSDLCRIKIRNIGQHTVLHHFISSLPLPKSLKGYLMMENEG